MTEGHWILLVGNGSHRNRGCEAIVKGTMKILRAQFGDGLAVRAGVYGDPNDIDDDARGNGDKAIRSFGLRAAAPRWSGPWIASKLNERLGTGFAGLHSPLLPHIAGAAVAMEMGGDNYSLDYGIPRLFLEMDRFLMNRKVPVVVWGASIGPFDKEPSFAPEMFSHLRKLAGLLVRETATQEYLERNGVSRNVQLVADPAFLMDPVTVPPDRLGFAIPGGAIGLNLSPLIAKYFVKTDRAVWELSDEDLAPWIDFSSEVVRTIVSSTGRTVVLIPHVSSPVHCCDDFWFLDAVRRKVADTGCREVLCVSHPLSAAELKSVIASCAVFCGARTHATIAAFSSCVPTLSFGYSMKARGINQDILGHLNYCLDAKTLSLNQVRDSVSDLLAHEQDIRGLLQSRIPVIQERAWSAGAVLKNILEDQPL